MKHMNELAALSNLFFDDTKIRTYFITKIFPFALKGAAKAWYDNLSPGSIKIPKDLVSAFFQKYFPAKAQHATLQNIFKFVQEKGEILPVSWARFCSLIRGVIKCPLAKNELLDIFYNGLTDKSRTYLDSCAGCVFRQRTPVQAEELLAKISKNYDDWNISESTPTPKKGGMIELSDEVMKG